MHRMKGFTLIELMITVVIIAVIAAIAVPNYTAYITRSKFTEAHANLADLRVKMEQYYMDNRRYGNSATATGANCGVVLTTAVVNKKYFDYSCTVDNVAGAGAQTYIVTATGRSDAGLTGIAFTINHAQARTTVVTASSQIANQGYAAGTASCWVTKKPAQC